ncbi:NINE protein [Demequina sediminicola]|uniref:NINE protein n=1 Tax=Demequina sediminicola TaxID=1095026 RepID=UPI00137912AD|nr:NINE protein [Demequina sediminicola]
MSEVICGGCGVGCAPTERACGRCGYLLKSSPLPPVALSPGPPPPPPSHTGTDMTGAHYQSAGSTTPQGNSVGAGLAPYSSPQHYPQQHYPQQYGVPQQYGAQQGHGVPQAYAAQPVQAYGQAPYGYDPYGYSSKSRVAYVLLGLFLGGLGIHNFYAGRTTTAVCQLLLMILLGWTIIAAMAVTVWVIVEVIAVTRDGDGLLLR